MTNLKKGFTLVELLVVIGILAVLATATVLILNPAEYLKQARDSNRVSDLGSIVAALSQMSALETPTNQWFGNGICKNSTAGVTDDTGTGILSTACTAGGADVAAARTIVTGWVDAGGLKAAHGLTTLPKDPVNTVGATTALDYVYMYKGGTVVGSPSMSTDYEIDARLESAKYMNTLDLDGTDGGGSADWYEVGSKLTM